MVNKIENFDIDPIMGKKVKDKVSGITGIVTGVLDCLYGCRQIVVTPQGATKDGEKKTNVALDEGRLTVIGQGIRPKAVRAKSGKDGGIEIPEEILKS